MTNNPKRKKLSILAEQLRKHAKASNLQVFIIHDGDEPGMAKALGNYGENMVQTVVAHVAMNHPEIFASTIEMINKLAEAQKPEEPKAEEKAEETPSLIVVP